nr:MAG TPA: hypothetical protein [Caudoviricetes sp.]
MANLAELFKSCKYLSPLNVVCVLKIITFRFTLNYNISFYNSLTFRFGGLTNQPLKPIHILFYATLAIKTKSALNHNMYSSY